MKRSEVLRAINRAIDELQTIPTLEHAELVEVLAKLKEIREVLFKDNIDWTTVAWKIASYEEDDD